MVVRNRVVVDEDGDGRLRAHGREARNVLRSAAEARAFQKMRGAVKAPVGYADRGEIVSPLGGSAAAAGPLACCDVD